MSNLYERVQRAWQRIKVTPLSPFIGWVWHRDTNRDIKSLRSQLPPTQDDMERLDNYLRLKEPWRYEDE